MSSLNDTVHRVTRRIVERSVDSRRRYLDLMEREGDAHADRNTALAARIDALHAAGQRLLVAVGALHMSGPEALPRLLAARGFEVKPVLPSK